MRILVELEHIMNNYLSDLNSEECDFTLDTLTKVSKFIEFNKKHWEEFEKGLELWRLMNE